MSMGVDASSEARAAVAAGDGEERSSSFDTTSLSSASDTEDVWTISDEQREYYIAQFKTMQVSDRLILYVLVSTCFLLLSVFVSAKFHFGETTV